MLGTYAKHSHRDHLAAHPNGNVRGICGERRLAGACVSGLPSDANTNRENFGSGLTVNSRGSKVKLAIFCDFDETITRTNVTDGVLERFADPHWLEIQEHWLAGKLSAREVLEYQMPLVTVTPEDLDAFINSIEIDPLFAEFALSCAQKNDSLYILSDGFDYWIDRILRRALSAYNGTVRKIPVFACGLSVKDNRLDISFPYFPQGCMHGCATCKPAIFNKLKPSAEKTIVIGDGVSDLILAKDADLVLAKDGLREFCQRKGILNQEYNDFSDVIRIISAFREKTFEDNIGDT